MKTKFFTLLILFSPSICFGMREPSNNSTNLRDPITLTTAITEKNIPLMLTLIQAGEVETSFYKTLLVLFSKEGLPINPLYRLAGLNAKFGIERYEKLAPALIEKTGLEGLAGAFISAAHDQAVEKVSFLLEKYSDQLSQETLNKAIDATLTTKRMFCRDIAHMYPIECYNPIFRFKNPNATKANSALLKMLLDRGATLSPKAASEALEAFQNRPYLMGYHDYDDSAIFDDPGKDDIRKYFHQNNAGCDQTRRDAVKFLLSRGGRFKEEGVCRTDCHTAFCAPCVQLDLHRAGKPFTVGSALGYALGCILCLPCNALATVRSCLPEEAIPLNLDTPPAAIRMDHQDSLEPALLTQQ